MDLGAENSTVESNASALNLNLVQLCDPNIGVSVLCCAIQDMDC